MFDNAKITESLLRETGMDIKTARKITAIVEERIENSEYLAGPLIREICCSVMAELKLHEYRKKYTRIGVPMFDYMEWLNTGLRDNANQPFNAESIHYWSANKIAEQAALLYLSDIDDSLALGHHRGDFHIHKLRFYMLRPFCAAWDLRMILRNGLPPGGSPHFAVSGTANHPIVAFLHAAKWLGIIQGNFQGGQGYDNFCEYLAPYVRGLPYDEIKQLAQCFIFESNQVYAARSQTPFTSIDTSPTVSEELRNIPAVSLKGKIDGVYGDYEKECRDLFLAFSETYRDGDANNRVFNFPKHEVKIKKQWLKKFEEEYMYIIDEAVNKGSPYFLNHPDWLPAQIHSQCCRIIMTKDGVKRFCRDPEKFDMSKSYMNIGSLQTISLNLPRYAYKSNRNDDLYIDILEEMFQKVLKILFIKKDLTEKLLKSGKSDVLSNSVIGPTTDEKIPLFDIDKYSLTIGFVGGNEAAEYHTGHQLHESDEAIKFQTKILKYLSKRCEEESIERQYNITLWEQPAEFAAGKFAMKDLKQFGNKIKVRGDIGTNNIYYTNSDHLNYSSDVTLTDRILKQAEFQKIVKGGVITHVWLGEANSDPEGLWKLTKSIANTDTAYFAYTFDFTQCMKCFKFVRGVHDNCPSCKSDDVEWWSRVTGYYSRVRRYNNPKFKEWEDRRRY
jgi:ribonucleoside-triphosphate reductase